MVATRDPIVYFYGKLAGATRADASKLARAAGYRVASTLNSGVDFVALGEGAPLAETRAALAAEFDERSRLAFENGTLQIITEREFLAEIAKVGLDEVPGFARRRGARRGCERRRRLGRDDPPLARGFLAPTAPTADCRYSPRAKFRCAASRFMPRRSVEDRLAKRIRAIVQHAAETESPQRNDESAPRVFRFRSPRRVRLTPRRATPRRLAPRRRLEPPPLARAGAIILVSPRRTD